MEKKTTIKLSRAFNKWKQDVQLIKTEYFISSKLLKKGAAKKKGKKKERYLAE